MVDQKYVRYKYVSYQYTEYQYVLLFHTVVQPLPAEVMSMVIDIDRRKWELPCNSLP